MDSNLDRFRQNQILSLNSYLTYMAIVSAYPTEYFAMKSMADLDMSDFARHPIWSEYYEHPERDEIIQWGVDPVKLDGLLKLYHDGNTHAVYTVLRPYPLPDRMYIYIKARFQSVDGDTFDGYVMNDDVSFFALFVRNDEFTFTRGSALSDLNTKEQQRLRETLAKPNLKLFPLEYQTDFLDEADQPICGMIENIG